jgi:hypothetical protein
MKMVGGFVIIVVGKNWTMNHFSREYSYISYKEEPLK